MHISFNGLQVSGGLTNIKHCGLFRRGGKGYSSLSLSLSLSLSACVTVCVRTVKKTRDGFHKILRKNRKEERHG